MGRWAVNSQLPIESGMLESFFHKVFNVLELHAGIHPTLREQFINAYLQFQTTGTVTKYDFPKEFRIGGSLGFGGKLWFRPDGQSPDQPTFKVHCYREDLNPQREAIIKKVNALLYELEESMM